MKQLRQWGFIVLLPLLLLSCVKNSYTPPTPDYSNETWQQQIPNDPMRWTKGADTWFLTADANSTEIANRHATSSAAITTSQVQVPDSITQLSIDGAFQTQIFGTDEHTSAFVFGPNAGVRNVAIDVRGNKVYVYQTDFVPPDIMKKVIVRIGIKNLTKLTQRGPGSIEAIRIWSKQLAIDTTPPACGDIYLSGKFNLQRIIQGGTGKINLFGADTSHLDVKTFGGGAVNINGRVGVRSIEHHGATDITIIGADSPSLTIDADGCGGGR